MTRHRIHTEEVAFVLRIEKRMNDYLTEWAKSEGKSKGLLIESIVGSAVVKRQNESAAKVAIMAIDEAPPMIDSQKSMERQNKALADMKKFLDFPCPRCKKQAKLIFLDNRDVGEIQCQNCGYEATGPL